MRRRCPPRPDERRARALERENRELRQANEIVAASSTIAEVIHRRGLWRSFEAVEFATLEWVDWFNNRRLMSSRGKR
jgi:transposase InsO family protein